MYSSHKTKLIGELNLILFILLFILIPSNVFGQSNNRIEVSIITYEFDEGKFDLDFTDSTTLYIKNKSEMTFDLLNDNIYSRIRIPDSLKNVSGSADTIITRSKNLNKNYSSTILKVFDSAGYIIEYFNTSCLACSSTPSRYYYIYTQGKVHTMIIDNLGDNSRQLYEISYDYDKSISQIIIFEKYQVKKINPFLFTLGKPKYKNDIEFSNRRIKEKVLIRYD